MKAKSIKQEQTMNSFIQTLDKNYIWSWIEIDLQYRDWLASQGLYSKRVDTSLDVIELKPNLIALGFKIIDLHAHPQLEAIVESQFGLKPQFQGHHDVL